MSTPIVFPDVELWATGYLRAALAGLGHGDVYVSNRRGNQTKAVWIRRDGGPVLDKVLEAPRLGVNVYAAGDTDQAVSELAGLVSALLRAGANGSPVVRVDQTSGPSPVPDPIPRRYLTFDLVVRGTELA